MTVIRQYCLEIFCPCTIYDRNRHLKRQEIPTSAWKRIWKDDTYENEIFKNILGFLGGILLGIFIYLVMVFQMDYTPLTASMIGFACIERVFKWFDGVTAKCNAALGKPARKCFAALKEGGSKCL
ncbi:hypothetical protein FSP39_022631 [Pinctada imbricata]|uniref:Uncharacterized protein n=1 Tax=Pinctada imbricata TaxID=66713 RepID=A0AA89BU65_PINIB|nr:hypothetical protein FSP39_022631 [Pinctada imbricata]